MGIILTSLVSFYNIDHSSHLCDLFMSTEIKQQLSDLLKNNHSFAIVIKEQWTTDELAAAVAWQLFLKAENKNAIIYCSGNKPDQRYDFLNTSEIRNQLLGKRYQINVDVSQSGVNELSYSVETNTLKIFITPNHGTISDNDIKLEPFSSPINALICIGLEEPTKAGKIFNEQSEIFYNLPTINIDFQPENVRFGSVNLIDITASSNCEISFETINNYKDNIISPEIATALMTGIIDATQSFLRGRVSPKSLQIASRLLELGAKRDKIISHLYQTKTVEQLRLWGSALKELKDLAGGKFLVSQLIDQDDSIDIEKVSGIVSELLINSPLAKIAALIIKRNNGHYKVILASNRSYDVLKLLGKEQASSNQPVIDYDDEEQVNEMINKISTYLEQF